METRRITEGTRAQKKLTSVLVPYLPGLKYPCNVHGNIHAGNYIHLKILEWASMVHGYNTDTWIPICIFPIDVLFGMDIAWTLQPGCLRMKVKQGYDVIKLTISKKRSRRELSIDIVVDTDNL